MRYIKLFTSQLLALLLSASASSAADEQRAPHRIAIVSQFETTMHRIHVAPFDGSDESRDVPSWHIAESAETDMVALLQQKGIAGDIAVLPQSGQRSRAGEGTDKEQAGIIQAARDAGFDTLILIQPGENVNFRAFGAAYGVAGVGHIMGVDVCAYASFMVVVYRTADARRIDWRWGYQSINSPFDFDSRGPCTDFEKYPVPWKDTLAQYTDEDMAVVEAAVKARIRAGMARALDGLDLD